MNGCQSARGGEQDGLPSNGFTTATVAPRRRRVRVVIPPMLATARQEQVIPMPETVDKVDSTDAVKDTQPSPIQMPPAQEPEIEETQVESTKMGSSDGPKDLPRQTSSAQEPEIRKVQDEPKNQLLLPTQTPIPEEPGIPKVLIDDPKVSLRLLPENLVSGVAVPKSIPEQAVEPIVKCTFFPPMVVKSGNAVNPVKKNSSASFSETTKAVWEDTIDTATTISSTSAKKQVLEPEPRDKVTTSSSEVPLKERLKQYQEMKYQDAERKMKEIKKKMTSLNQVPQFIPGKVPISIQEQKKALPIFAVKEQLIEVIKNNQIVILTGETGSGKTTQLPQYIAEAGLHGNCRIAITQPRRVAARSVATRVTAECGVELGTMVGYKIRFDRSFGDNTVIKFVTDGVLVNELACEDTLAAYSVVIIDEAHERTIKTDLCLGLLKKAARKRPDLKIIVSSATLEKEKFLEYFENSVLFEVKGKVHPIDIVYKPDRDYLCGAVDIVLDINRKEEKGDILVFLAGQDEIEQVWEMIETRLEKDENATSNLIIVPCYSALPFEDQQKIFEPAPDNYRKVVLATNIAETSLTVDGIKYVIDCGYFKEREYNPKSDIYALVRKEITKSQAIQRCGRAGRTQPGICYRLYSQEFYEKTMETGIKPDIVRLNVESVTLDIMAMGIDDPLQFDFIDPPTDEAILEAFLHLKQLSALDDDLNLTRLGREMSKLPLTPRLAKVVLESEMLGCADEVIKIVAMLNTNNYHNIFKVEAGKNSRERLDIAKERLKEKRKCYEHPDGDMLTLLNIYETWASENFSKDWCRENFIQYRILKEAREIHQELRSMLRHCGFAFDERHEVTPVEIGKTKSVNIRKAFTSGFFRQVVKRKRSQGEDPGNLYYTLGNPGYVEGVLIHPSSSLYSTQHQYLIYHDVLTTKRSYIQGVIKVELRWIEDLAPEFELAKDYRT